MKDCRLCLLLVLVLAPQAWAQKLEDYVEGFSRARPILRPASEAPTATIRQLRFNDAKNLVLYAAGDDKLVRRWTITPAPAGGITLDAGTPLTWPIYRAVRGVVYALDVHSNAQGDFVAFGGVGTKTSWVNLLQADQTDQAQLLLDPGISQRDNIVNAVAFHSSGAQLAVAHERTGMVLLWDVGSSAAKKINTGLSNVWALSYAPKSDVLVLAGFRTATAAWEVQQWNSATQTLIKNVRAFGAVSALSWGNDNTWVAATTAGIQVQDQRQPHSLGDVRGLVGPRNGSPYVMAVFDDATRTMQLKTWNGDSQPDALAGAAFVGKDIALDVSADGRLLAAGGSIEGTDRLPAYTIRLWDLATRQLLAELPNAGQRKTLGAPIASVGVIPGGQGEGGKTIPYSIGFAWGPPPGRNLPAYQFQYNRITHQISPYSGALGRESQPRRFFDAKLGDKPVVYLADERSPKTDPWGPLPVWADRRPDCFAAQEQLGLLALGYSDGIVLCDLAKLRDARVVDKDKSIVRSFYGHEGPVTCMSFSPDGKLLLSGSKDGTICGWKIDDLAGRSGQTNELGVQFARQANGRGGVSLVVQRDPPAGSIGAEAGFRAGQIINSIQVAGVTVPAAEWERTLAAPVPGKELIVHVRQPDLNKVIGLLPTPVSHDALWTMYPQRDFNWSLWTPEGHYLTPEGKNERLAWHLDLNQMVAADGSLTYEGSMVLFDRNLQELFHSEKIVTDAMIDLLPDRPKDAIVAPNLDVAVRGNRATLTVKRNGRQPVAELELWLNGCRLKRLTREQLSGGSQETVTVDIPTSYLRADGNQLTAVAAVEVVDAAGKSKALVYNRKRSRLPGATAAAATIARKLHYVGVGVSKLDGDPPGLAALDFPGHDAVELGQQLQKNVALGAGYFETLADFQGCRPPTEDNIIQLLTDLPRRVGPNDLAIVFLAGHGVAENGFRFIAKDTTSAAKARLSDRVINDLLAQLPCRTMLILDTCHAQGAQLDQKLNDWPGFGLGPMILASCDFTKESFEDERLKLPAGLQGHGLFTGALLEGLLLDGQRVENRIKKPPLPARDVNKDGRITIEEWCLYAQQRTAMLSDLGISPFSKPGKDSYTPKVLPSFSFLDHKNFIFAGK